MFFLLFFRVGDWKRNKRNMIKVSAKAEAIVNTILHDILLRWPVFKNSNEPLFVGYKNYFLDIYDDSKLTLPPAVSTYLDFGYREHSTL